MSVSINFWDFKADDNKLEVKTRFNDLCQIETVI